jgi:beta-phosphoglucomutase-like phosphatase (HAD superfamily)
MSAQLRGVLWDLDGTVVDSEPSWFRAETVLVERFGGTWDKRQAMALVGSDLRDTAAGLQAVGVAMETDALVNALLDVVIEDVMATRPWRAGVPEALAACAEAGLSSVLVSMSWRRFTHAAVDLLPGAFTAVVSGDDVTRGKPDPEAYLLGAEKLGLAPSECVAVEDSPTGAASSVGAGVPTVALRGHVDVPPQPGLVKIASAAVITPGWLRETHRRLLAELE